MISNFLKISKLILTLFIVLNLPPFNPFKIRPLETTFEKARKGAVIRFLRLQALTTRPYPFKSKFNPFKSILAALEFKVQPWNLIRGP